MKLRPNPPIRPERLRADLQRTEKRRLAPMMRALKAIHSATSPESMAPEDLERQRKGQEVLGPPHRPHGRPWRGKPFSLSGMKAAWVRPSRATTAAGPFSIATGAATPAAIWAMPGPSPPSSPCHRLAKCSPLNVPPGPRAPLPRRRGGRGEGLGLPDVSGLRGRDVVGGRGLGRGQSGPGAHPPAQGRWTASARLPGALLPLDGHDRQWQVLSGAGGPGPHPYPGLYPAVTGPPMPRGRISPPPTSPPLFGSFQDFPPS